MGIATCISFGKVGWFGNLIVKEEIRHKGAGSLLVKHAIDYLQGKGVETIGLYAYPNLKTSMETWVLKQMRNLLSFKPKRQFFTERNVAKNRKTNISSHSQV